MSGMESIVENWWNEGNGAYGPPAYNPLKKTVGAASNEMNLRNEWSKEFLSAASSIKIKDFVCRWNWLWLICPAALSLLSLIPPLACLYFSSQRVKGCSERESWLKWKDSWSVGWSPFLRYIKGKKEDKRAGMEGNWRNSLKWNALASEGWAPAITHKQSTPLQRHISFASLNSFHSFNSTKRDCLLGCVD